eukprot:m.973728 g.973728  ORF g.973728 m.973728 type:complete len:410 (-) comp23936_c0_seq17:2055-3284(-)
MAPTHQRWLHTYRTAITVLIVLVTAVWQSTRIRTSPSNNNRGHSSEVSNKEGHTTVVASSKAQKKIAQNISHKIVVSSKKPWWQSPSSVAARYEYKFPTNGKLIAIGDVHGDVGALTKALLLAKAINAQLTWIGGDLVVVQMGDNLDRGQDEIPVLKLLTKLHKEATLVGGAVHVVLGNHEIMNVLLDFRYVSQSSLLEYRPFGANDVALETGPKDRSGPGAEKETREDFSSRDSSMQSLLFARARAYRPGGFLAASVLANRRAVLIVGDSVFVHGGLLPEHANNVQRINTVVREWLVGAAAVDDFLMQIVESETSVFWTRRYSQNVDEDHCRELRDTLSRLNVTRLVVGHTPQLHGITQACNGAVWRIDTGMAAWFEGMTDREIQILQIETVQGVSSTRVIKENDSSL